MLKMPIKTVVSLRIWDSPYAFLSESVAIGAQGSQRSSVQKQRRFATPYPSGCGRKSLWTVLDLPRRRSEHGGTRCAGLDAERLDK